MISPSAILLLEFLSPSLVDQTQLRKQKTMAYSLPYSETTAKRERVTAPYGSWKSPITADIVSGASKRLGGISVDGEGCLIWLESRPNEAGRSVLVKEPEKPGDEPVDITPKEFAVRTACQEYGGGAFCISGDTLVFSNYKDQRLYKQSLHLKESLPLPITPDYGGPSVCYADGVFDSRFGRYVTVREDRRENSLNPTTTVVAIGLGEKDMQDPKVLISGNDFYAFPRMDPKGEKIAWIEWGHPNMPWDKAELWVGYISEAGFYKRLCVAGHNPKHVESPTEPKWSPEDKVLPLCPLNAEFARPLWVFGMNSYEVIQSDEQKTLIACSYRPMGRSHLAIIDVLQSSLVSLDIPFTDIQDITAGNNCLYIEGASGVLPTSVAKVSFNDERSEVIDFQIIRSSSPDKLIEFPTIVPGQNAYAYFYPPSNHFYQASQEEKPPLLLKSHGGPTRETRGVLNLSIQYWTSRGWAFVDVNYGGSTGYGREFRERLLGCWGIVDVDDCCSCAEFLVESRKVDGNRLCITGVSAGGYTTLAALAFRETFRAGASLYGVADLNMLKAETHKFESPYLDNFVVSAKDCYERSPINFVEKFSCPIILFQGLEDKVVPPDQGRKIYAALKQKGLPVALVEYEGEQHGFRKAENIKFTLEQQMLFFARLVRRFDVANEITPIKIDNLD
ncbi:hypothetical protein ACJRO7_022330 [Eucalyptus globulus]|uniref:Peptidase S9 prolyl oligopeptidase catalytic domain-containing protein n=1 Tax=Eucalyptus globulus TaxID=34317 RepID=A0ABD3K2N4_EUCGL